MFYQNSNDLVKHASAKSGHVQNSKETSRLLISETQPRHIKGADTPVNFDDNNSMSSPQHSSLSIGAQFQNMIQGLFSTPIKEGLEGAGGGGGGGGRVAPANPSSGGISGISGPNQVAYVNRMAAQDKQYTREAVDHNTKVGNIISLIENSNQNQRNIWVEVTDSSGITKYGYITRNGVFQIWHVPMSPSSNPPNWLETDTVKQNMGVIGCPAQSGSIQKIKIAGTWEKIKPYDLIHDVADTAKSKPFIIINDVVRDPKNSVQGKGLFSCGNESGNVYVTERPSADFYLNDPDIKMGCYVLADNVTEDNLTNRGFTFQEDLHEASISQCKRRAEDLGSSYFMISALNQDRPNDKGGCWVYTSKNNLNIKGLLEFDESGQKCHAMGNPEPDEDGYLNAYPMSKLKRLYGKETTNLAKTQRSVSLYSLKKGGPNGVDTTTGRNGLGMVGRLAYIDYNGERHDYPESALSYMKPSKNAAGETLPAAYLNLGAYDTRSMESSYSLKELSTPGSFSEASNLLYKASRDGWSAAAFHRKCDNKGATYTRAIITDGRVLGAYTSLSWSSTIQNYQHDTTAFMYDGKTKYFSTYGAWGAGQYATYMNSSNFPTFGGGHDMYISGKHMYSNSFTFLTAEYKGPFGRNKQTYQDYPLKDIEVYAVNAETFPTTLEYARQPRAILIGESVVASFDKCRGLCDADEKCGGFVYTKGSAGTDEKCDLKDRTKMYPIGLRVADPTKQLMLKVPTINETISDKACKVGNGAYKMIDSAQYRYYPDTGAMISGTKCDIRELIPKDGTTEKVDLKPIYGAVSDVFEETESKIAEYRAQTAIAPPPPKATTGAEGFGVLREYMDPSSNYAETMNGVAKDLKNIANAEYQRERLLAITEETNKLLMAESYKFILWSVLAILAVLAVLKLKEMFGQDDADDDDDGGGGGGGGGLLATILGWFGVGSVKTDDIPDRTEDIKAALSSAGDQMKEAGTNLATGITEGADNLVNSANDAATGAIEGANNLVDKAKEVASGAIDKIGAAASSATATATTTTSVQPPSTPQPTTGGKKHSMKTTKRTK